MGRSLSCKLEAKTKEGLRYWFPLLYELCISHDLKFVNPYFSPKPIGHYLYNKDGDVETADGSFKDMWDKIYAGFGIGVTFWFDGLDGTDIELYINWEEAKAQLEILLDISGAAFALLTLERATWLMTRIVELCKKIYLLCKPFEAEIYWENSSGRFPAWAAFGEVPKLAKNAMRVHLPIETELLSNVFEGKAALLFLDPVAIVREKREWEFVSIAGGLTGEIERLDDTAKFFS